MKSFIEFIIQRNMTANILTLAIFMMGIYSLCSLPLAELPRVDLGKGTIETDYPGASAEDVEANVTSLIEKELLTISDIKKFVSTSREGRSEIDIELKSDVKNTQQAYQDIRDALSRVNNFPAGVTQKPVFRAKKSSSLDFMVVGVSSDKSYAELRQQARSLELSLRRLSGIGEVLPKDMRAPEFWLQLEPEQLKRYNLTLAEVADIISKRNVLMSGGNLESYKTAQNLLTLSEVKDIDSLKNIQIKSNPNVYLKDLAGDISAAHERAKSYMTINGVQSIGFDLRTSDSADVIATSARVKALLQRYQENNPDFQFHIGFDLADEIVAKFGIVKNNGIAGLALVLLTLTLILNRRISLWVALSIPFSLFGVIALLPQLGQVLDGYTLAAMILIIGIIVDDSVVVAEKIAQRYEDGEDINRAIREALKQVMPAVITSMLTTALAFIPLMLLPGNSGKMLYVMPLTVSLALLFSLIDVVFVLPAHLRRSLPKAAAATQSEIKGNNSNVIRQRFSAAVHYYVSHRYLSVPVSALLLLTLGWYSFHVSKYSFFPTDGAYLIEISTEVSPSLSLEQSLEANQQINQIIADSGAEVARWYADIGAPYSSYLISLTPSTSRDLSADQVLENLEQQIESLDGFADIELEVDAGGPPKGRPIDLTVVAGTDEQRAALADTIKAWLEQKNGVERVNRASEEKRPVIVADINHQRLNRYGISTYDIARALRLGIDGERISRVFSGEEEIYYRVLLDENDRSIEELENMVIRTADGRLISIAEVVEWKMSETPAAIKHYNGERSIRVSASVDTGITDSITVESELNSFVAGLENPGARYVSTGQAKESKEALIGLTVALAIAVAAIWLTMILLFDGLRESLLIMSIVPLGVSAGVIVLFLHGQPLSFFAIVGIIGLIGVMVNNCLVLMCHYRDQPALAANASPQQRIDFVVAGSVARSRAVLLTTLTTVAGLVPLAYGFGGYDNYMGPIALVLGWGVMASSVITLFVLPAIYAMSEDFRWKSL